MQDYQEIFNQRGDSYHLAMKKYPDARYQELISVLQFLKAGDVVLDIPSGGGYLEGFLDETITYLPYDFSGEFADNHTGISKCTESRINIEDHIADKMVCLAAHHHIVERIEFYRESKRVLKEYGELIIIDPLIGSKPATFLNNFVNSWNSMGHKGEFLDFEADSEVLKTSGFKVTWEKHELNWMFDNREELLDFTRMLFYLDKNPDDELLYSSLSNLGVQSIGGKVQLNWDLGVIIAQNM